MKMMFYDLSGGAEHVRLSNDEFSRLVDLSELLTSASAGVLGRRDRPEAGKGQLTVSRRQTVLTDVPASNVQHRTTWISIRSSCREIVKQMIVKLDLRSATTSDPRPSSEDAP